MNVVPVLPSPEETIPYGLKQVRSDALEDPLASRRTVSPSRCDGFQAESPEGGGGQGPLDSNGHIPNCSGQQATRTNTIH